jgi:hypothetical protein
MERRSAVPESAFAKELRSFQTGGVTFSDLRAQLHLHLASGASPKALADVLRAREAVEPLPGDIREELMQYLEVPSDGGDAATPIEDSEATTIILGESAASTDDPPPASARSRSLVAGDLLAGRFRLQALVGEGGMSRVFKATDSTPADEYSLAQFIAVKVLARPFNEDAESFAKLQQDVRQLRGLSHPNIVRLFGCYRDDTLIFVTLEFLEGESLYSKLVRASAARLGTGLEGNEARRIIAAVAAALQYAHEHQVVHGDLKPGNVIVDPHGAVKVIDFGMANWIARPRSALERRETINVKVAVTPRYASPQLMARQKPAAGDDVYALACLSYELLTGLHPFDDGSGATTARFPPPRRAGLTVAEHAAIVHGLERDRGNRTATVTQFVQEFAPPKRALAGRVMRIRWACWASWAGWAAAALLAVLAASLWLARPHAPAPMPAPAHARHDSG